MSEDLPILLSVPDDDVFVTQRGTATLVKDYAAVRNYGVDLTDWLLEVGDTLDEAFVELDGIDAADPDSNFLPTILLLPNDSTGIQKVAVRLCAGVDQSTATFTFTTVNGSVDRRIIRFLIRER